MKKCRFVAGGFLIAALLSGVACPRPTVTDDRAITEGIQSKLYLDATLKKRDISVISERGVVVLTGQVSSEDEKSAAQKIATEEGGVKQVINQLAVVVSAPAATPKSTDLPSK